MRYEGMTGSARSVKKQIQQEDNPSSIRTGIATEEVYKYGVVRNVKADSGAKKKLRSCEGEIRV